MNKMSDLYCVTHEQMAELNCNLKHEHTTNWCRDWCYDFREDTCMHVDTEYGWEDIPQDELCGYSCIEGRKVCYKCPVDDGEDHDYEIIRNE